MSPGPRTNEAAFNAILAETLRHKHPLWRDSLGVERNRVFPRDPGLRPDILIAPPKAQPVVLETEFVPGTTVEKDARSRLGLSVGGPEGAIEQAIAIRIPAALREGQADLPDRIGTAEFEYCVLSGAADDPERWPKDGWLRGGVDDIARCAEQAMVSQRLVDEGISILEEGVNVATRAIQDSIKLGDTDTDGALGRALSQRAGEQTRRMAMTIIANALTFHDSIAGSHGIPGLAKLRQEEAENLRPALLGVWERILNEINYWPIFHIASDLLAILPSWTAHQALKGLACAAERLSRLGVNARHDLSGRMFQKMIVDRKFLATFYTLPTSSTLLAELAIRRLRFDWEDLDGYADLRIADLSCGTGTLLSSAYHATLSRYRHAGGDDREAHRAMMERAIVAADIMPAAAHLCASQLSSFHPGVVFDNTRVYTLPYGVERSAGEGTAIGSLDLISAKQAQSLFSTGQRRAGGGGEEETRDIKLPHGSVDLVIMNPPFTRPTNHENTEAPVPSFAGFKTTRDEQCAMSDRLAAIQRDLILPAGHGNAGLASNFIDLAHAKVKPSGIIALVLPITVTKGESWRAARELLRREYRDITVITIATVGNTDRAFSADTGMAEALVLGTKANSGEPPDDDALFVNLARRPATLLEAAEVSRLVGELPASSRMGHLRAGKQGLGVYIRAPLDEGGCAALRDASLAETLMELKRGQLRMSRYGERHSVPIVELGELGERGLLYRDIGSLNPGAPPYRGPFRVVDIGPAPDYPMLWGHAADRERRLVVAPDKQGEVLPGCEDRAVEVWETATRMHFSLNFRLNSQSLAACRASGPIIGGGAWPSFRLSDSRWEDVVVLWANSTLGLMCFWWRGSLQQQGRSRLTISTLPELRVLDPRALTDLQLERAAELFGEFQERIFLPANEAYRDEVRVDLDRAVMTDLLGYPEAILEPLANLRLKWCHEPSVHGGKSSRPSAGG